MELAPTLTPTPDLGADPMLEVLDGSRAIQVTALLGETVIKVRHLRGGADAGSVARPTWALLAMGGVACLLVLPTLALGQPGLAALLLALGVGVVTVGALRYREERRPPHFTVGPSSRADLNLVLPGIASPSFPLVRHTDLGWTLLCTERMRGELVTRHGRWTLQELVRSGRSRLAEGVEGAYEIEIPEMEREAQIRVSAGACRILINIVAPSRRVGAPLLSRIDWPARYLGGALAGHVVVVGLALAAPPSSIFLLSSDRLRLPPVRVRARIVMPSEVVHEPYLKHWGIPGRLEELIHSGRPEGKMGSPTSRVPSGLYGLKGPKDCQDPHLARREAEEADNGITGVLDLLKSAGGSHLTSIFGRDTALGTDADKALGELTGHEVKEAYGVGGLGVLGQGRGGGAHREETVGTTRDGYSQIGRGGGYGRLAGGLRGRRTGVVRVIAGRVETRGMLNREIINWENIRRVIRRHINEVKYCYQRELQAQPDLLGRLTISFTIDGSGRVVASSVQESTLQSSRVGRCVADAVRRWRFPKPKGGGSVVVRETFLYKPAGR